MALIKNSAIVTEISGHLGDVIYSRNKGGPYVKDFASPVQPDSAKQIALRQFFTNAVNAWHNLSDADFDSYVAFSTNFSNSKFNGSVKKVDPKSFFISNFIYKQLAGAPGLPSPVMPSSSGFASLDIDIPDSFEYNFTLDGGVLNTDFAVICYTSHPRNIGVRSLNSVQQISFSAIAFEPGVTFNLKDDFDTGFPGEWPIIPQNLFASVKVIHKESGIQVGGSWNKTLMDLPFFNATLGLTTAGPVANNNVIQRSQLVTPLGNGFMDSIELFHTVAAGTFRLGVYSDNAGEPENLIAQSALTAFSGPNVFQKVDLLAPLVISTGVVLHLSYSLTGTFGTRFFVTGGFLHENTNVTDVLADPFNPTISRTWELSLFANVRYFP